MTDTEGPGEGNTYPRAVWRLLKNDPADGAFNMALDEAILLAVSQGRAAPTLRLYTWQPPCLSVGYAQPLIRDFDLRACRAMGYNVVRRPTGGRAILHIDELTYSVTLLQDDPRLAGGVVSSYQCLSKGLLAGLRRLGVDATQAVDPSPGSVRAIRTPTCFDLPSYFEITVGGKKLVGSAQVRRGGGVLQHGTLPLWGDISRIVHLLRLSSEEHRAQMASRLVKRATTLAQVAGRMIPFDEAAQALVAGFAEALNLELAEGELTAWERERAERLRRKKYGAWEYTFQR